MASLNQVNLIGNVGKDPEVKAINDNQRVAEFSLATSRKYKGQDGQVKEETEWHNIVLFGSLADLAAKYIKKGGSVYVGGRIRTRDWTDMQGVKHYKTEIVGDTVQLLGAKGDSVGAGAGTGVSQQASAPQVAPVQAPTFAPAQEYDDLPFGN